MTPQMLMTFVGLVDEVAAYVYGAAGVLLGAVAVSSLLVSSVRMYCMGSGKDAVEWAVRFLTVVIVYALYDDIFSAALTASTDLTAYFYSQADWMQYFSTLPDKLQSMFTSNAEQAEAAPWDPAGLGVFESMIGMLRGGLLSVVYTLSYFLVITAFQFVQLLTALCTSVLRVLGPLMIVGGVFDGGRTVRSWGLSLVQVMLWPVVPPLVLMMVTGASSAVAFGPSENTAYVIAQNCIMVLLAFLSPLVVSFLTGRAGVTALVTGTTAIAMMASRAALGTTSLFRGGVRGVGGRPAAGSSATQALVPRTSAVVRPGDPAMQQWMQQDMARATSRTGKRRQPLALPAPRMELLAHDTLTDERRRHERSR